MNRSAGVTAIAVLVLIGSALFLLIGGLMIVVALLPVAKPAGTNIQRFSLLISSIFNLGLSGWGIATGIALLRLKPWARISILILSGLLLFSTAMPGFVVWFLPIPQQSDMRPELWLATRVFLTAFFALLVAVAVWWLIYFTRASVKQQFLGEAPPLLPPARPVSITVIAWYLVLTGLVFPFVVLFRWPASLFGVIVEGWPAAAFYLAYGAAGLMAGVGLLKLNPRARILAIGLFLFGVVNNLLFFLLPGLEGRIAYAEKRISFGTPPPTMPIAPSMFVAMGVISVALLLVPIWFLVRRKEAFFGASRSPHAVS